MRVRATVRRMGNSLGVVIPRKVAKDGGIVEGDTVELEVERRVNREELFGSWKTRKSAQELKDEAREGWEE